MNEMVATFLTDYASYIFQGITGTAILFGGWAIRKAFVFQSEFDEAQAVTDKRLTSIEAKQQKRDDEISALREKLDGLPGKDIIHALDLKLAAIQSSIQAEQARSSEEMRGLQRSISRMEHQVELLYRNELESKNGQ